MFRAPFYKMRDRMKTLLSISAGVVLGGSAVFSLSLAIARLTADYLRLASAGF
jgi:hypothetical protein